MHTLEITPPQFKELTEKVRDLLTRRLQDVPAKEKDVKMLVNSRLFTEAGKAPFFIY
jgi:uncharacterized protein (DUF1810 family)